MPKIDVIIPAFNEENSIGNVLAEIPKDFVNEIVVVNNASTDETEKNAKAGGATVLKENRKGYGFACLKGMDYIHSKAESEQPEIIVFLDADYSDYPEEMKKVAAPIIHEDYDMVIGSRDLGERASGSMMPQQIFGNWLATKMIRWMYGFSYTDLGPFRAIKWERLKQLKMEDQTYGWTVEMQVKAVKQNFKIKEIPVNYRKRIGKSKVTGTIKGTVMAGYLIIYTILKYAMAK